MQFNEFEYHFACRRKGVHLSFIVSPGKIIGPYVAYSFRAMTVALTVSFKLISF